MWFIKKLIQNPIKVGIERAFKSFLLEKKNANNSKIGYMSTVQWTSLWVFTTIKNEVMLLNSEVWDYTYISHACNISHTTIWKFCSIGQNVKAWLGKHPTDFVSTHPAFYSIWKQCQITFSDKNYFQEREKIIIWNDVWIGSNVVIMDGVTIGDWAIVWAGSIVTKDIEPYAIVGWVPAKLIRYRFDEEDRIFLGEYKWWNNDINWIRENYKSFHDVKNFIRLVRWTN